MTEAEARAWLERELNVSRETIQLIEGFIAFLKEEAQHQNLIAASTFDSVWNRHIADSAQLLRLLPSDIAPDASWLDLGSGAGFPGLIAAILSQHKVCLVESRARRIDYLKRAAAYLGLENRVRVAGTALERLETAKFDVISARAFAPLPRLLQHAARFSTDKSFWLLPKGQNAVKELEEMQQQAEWSARIDFTVIPSQTSQEAGIIAGRLKSQNPGRRRNRQ